MHKLTLRRIIIPLFLAILTICISFAYCGRQGFFLDKKDYGGTLIWGVVVFLLSCKAKACTQCSPKSLKLVSSSIALIIAVIISLSKNYFYHFDWAICLGSKNAIALLLLQMCGYGLVSYYILNGIIFWLETKQLQIKKQTQDFTTWFWANILIRLLLIGVFFPCIFDFDAALGLRTFIDPNSAICNHHPVFVQSIHAIFYQLGASLGYPSIGFAILAFFSSIWSSYIIVYGIKLLSRLGICGKWLWWCAFILTFFPLFPYLSIVITKDGFFSYAMLLYILTILESIRTKGECLTKPQYILIHSIAILAVCLTRHQGFAIVLIEFLYLIICFRSWRKRLLFSTLPAFLSYWTITYLLFPVWGIEPGGKQEVFGTLFQQTAYYLNVYPEDVTPEESAAIDAILGKESIICNYKEYITDPVKNGYKYNPRYLENPSGPRSFRHVDNTKESKELKAYLSAWSAMGLRHPACYLEASASIFLGFFYNNGYALIDFYTKGAENPMATTTKFHFWRNNYISEYYSENNRDWASTPILGWFCSIPYYLWATIILLILIIYRKDWNGLAVFLPVVLSIGILFVCPVVNGRYAIPIVVLLPILFFYVLATNKSNKALI